jgi:hypothetical protein
MPLLQPPSRNTDHQQIQLKVTDELLSVFVRAVLIASFVGGFATGINLFNVYV